MTNELTPKDKIPQEALRLINEISGLNAVIPTMEEDPSIIGGYFEIERKDIATLKELYDYKNSLETKLRNYSANPIVQDYIQELDYSKDAGKLNLTISKLGRESALGGRILKDVWSKCFDNGFNMDYLDNDGELLGEKESTLQIWSSNDMGRRIIIKYGINGIYPGIILEQHKPRFIERIKGNKSEDITASFHKNNGDYEEGIPLRRVINVIDRFILENGWYSTALKKFRKIVLNLPYIMNKYLESKLGD